MDSLRQNHHATIVASSHETAYAPTVTVTVLPRVAHPTSVNAIHDTAWPIQYAYSVWRMIFSPRDPPRYTCATATKTSATAAMR